MTATPRTLIEMQNYPTAYEVAINDRVVTYSARKTKRALLEIAQQHGQEILGMLGDWDGEAIYKNGRWMFGPVTVRFTGRTERDAASALGLIN